MGTAAVKETDAISNISVAPNQAAMVTRLRYRLDQGDSFQFPHAMRWIEKLYVPTVIHTPSHSVRRQDLWHRQSFDRLEYQPRLLVTV